MHFLDRSWIQPYTEGDWVRFFVWLGGGHHFPAPRSSEAAWYEFAESVSIAPLCITICGSLTAVIILVTLCCCGRRQHPRVLRKPSSKPVICLALLTAIFLTVGVATCLSVGGNSIHTAEEQLDNAASTLTSATKQGSLLNDTGIAILNSLDNLTKVCDPNVVDTIKSQLDPLTQQVATYVGDVQKYSADILPLQQKVVEVRSHSNKSKMPIFAALLLPIVLVTAACGVIVSAVLVTRGLGRLGMARCSDCCSLRLGSSCMSLVILIAAVFATSEVALAIGASAFCMDIDANVLSYSSSYFGKGSTEFQAISHYISGAPAENPLGAKLTLAASKVSNAQQMITSLESSYGKLLQNACQGWTATSVVAEFATVQTAIHSCMDLLNSTNIYPYYQQIVHEDACGTVIVGLGWLSVLQVLSGILFLPFLGATSRSFFAKWAVWCAHLPDESPEASFIPVRSTPYMH